MSVLDPYIQSLPEPSPEHVRLMTNFAKKLRFKYRPEMFSNPALQSFYTNLEALVYDEEAKEIEDLTLPEINLQDGKIAPFLDDIEEAFGIVSHDECHLHLNLKINYVFS